MGRLCYPVQVSAVNPATREIAVKIVYYGPGLGGKTSSLQAIHQSFRADSRGPLVSLATGGDRTLYFDFLPVTLANLRGYSLRVQLYTVPGQVQYNATRKLVLAGCDGVVFVADSQPFREAANAESLENLRENLAEQGMHLEHLPHVLQLNKRDVHGAQLVSDMAAQLNPHGAPQVETVATTGQGVFDGLRSILALVLSDLRRRGIWDGGDAHPPTAVPEFHKPHTSISARIEALADEGVSGDDGEDQDYVVEVERVEAVLADEPGASGKDGEREDEAGDDDDEAIVEIQRIETSEETEQALASGHAPPDDEPAPEAQPETVMTERDDAGPAELVSPREVVAVERAEVADEPAPEAVILDGRDEGDASAETAIEPIAPAEIVAIERAGISDEPAPEAVILDDHDDGALDPDEAPNDPVDEPVIVVEPTRAIEPAPKTAVETAADAFAVALSAGGEAPPLARAPTVTSLDWAALLSDGPEREAVVAVLAAIAHAHYAEAVCLAARAFDEASLTTSRSESGPLLHALARGLSGRRYLRFRALAEEAEQGRASSEDALYAAFFLIDATLDR